ncbi:HNH endonuclease, partial [Streptomyces bobili]
MRPTNAAITAAAVLSLLAALFTQATAHSAGPGDTIAVPVDDALAALPVRDEDRTGYERTKFRHWTDADHDSCSTRSEVLL